LSVWGFRIDRMSEVGWDEGEGDDVVMPEDSGAGMSRDEVAAWAAVVPLGSGLLTPWGVLEPESLSDAGRIDALVACQRLQGWADAQQLRLLAAVAASADPAGKGFVREEIGCALRLSPAVVSATMSVATELTSRLPATLAVLESGAISVRHARLLAEAVIALSDEAAAAVQARVLPRAPQQTVAAFRAAVHRAVLSVDPRTGQHKHEAALAQRRVCMSPQSDGMAELWALLPADGAAALMTTLTALAATAPPGDPRTADQRRADALIDLATTRLTSPHPTSSGPAGGSVGGAGSEPSPVW
jgi:hypothetical protein